MTREHVCPRCQSKAISRAPHEDVLERLILMLRRKQPQADAFRVPAGSTIAILTLAFCGLLFTQTPTSNLSVVLITIAIAALNWLLVRKSGAALSLKA